MLHQFQNLISAGGLLNFAFCSLSFVTDVFLELFKNYQNSYVKGQSYFHAAGTIGETDELLKDLIRSTLSLVMHNICKFKTF